MASLPSEKGDFSGGYWGEEYPLKKYVKKLGGLCFQVLGLRGLWGLCFQDT